jgi:hypothetical protein
VTARNDRCDVCVSDDDRPEAVSLAVGGLSVLTVWWVGLGVVGCSGGALVEDGEVVAGEDPVPFGSDEVVAAA